MRRMCVLLAWAAGSLHAAMLSGTVLENQTSKPLSGAQVALEQVGGAAGGVRSVRTGRNGSFEFLSLPAGSYVIKASRRGFMPMEFGQKRWNSAGTPVAMSEDGSLSVTLRLPRFGGITGTIVDENDVGWLEGDVLAYRYAEGQPPALAARGHSDERGVYRISGLDPGMYLVRSAPMQTVEGSFLPTFSKEAVKAEESRPVEVYLEQDTTGVDVRPAEGRLFTLTGSVVPPNMPATVTLVSDMGRVTMQGSSFRFTGLSPAAYEIYGYSLTAPIQAAYRDLGILDHDSSVSLQMLQMPERRVEASPSPPGGTTAIHILARRKDLAGVTEPEALHVVNNLAPMGPGRWELMLTPPDGFYVAEFSGGPFGRGAASRPDGWNEAGAGAYNSIRFTLSSSPGGLHGVVKSSGEPAPGAPVYLEGYDPAARRRVTDLRTVRTDMRGLYHFEGLAPGVYRVLSTFEYRSPDSAQMERAGARTVGVAQGGDLAADLDLYEIR